MKQVYNLAGLMRKLKVDSFSELQERGYDVRSYLEQREQELADELEAIRQGLQELDTRDEEIARDRTQSELNDEFDTPFSSTSANLPQHTRSGHLTPSQMLPAMAPMRTLLSARHSPPTMTIMRTMRTFLSAHHAHPEESMSPIMTMTPICQAILVSIQ